MSSPSRLAGAPTTRSAGELEPWDDATNRDLASVVTMVLIGDLTLAGPPPAHVFDPVPHADYLDAILRDIWTVDEYLPSDTRNVVLTLARIWSAVVTGEVYSKEQAADWAMPRLPEEHRQVLELARAAYRGDADDSWDDRQPQARVYADHVVGEIQRLAQSPTTRHRPIGRPRTQRCTANQVPPGPM